MGVSMGEGLASQADLPLLAGLPLGVLLSPNLRGVVSHSRSALPGVASHSASARLQRVCLSGG